MNDNDIRAALTCYWTDVTNQSIVDELYHEDAILEFPQSGERMIGLANIRAMRAVYPADVTFAIRRMRGSGALWITELDLTYNGATTIHVANIMEFEDDLVGRETIYFGDPFEAPSWRQPWVEPST